MQSKNLFLALALGTASLFTSCDKADDNTATTLGGEYVLAVNVSTVASESANYLLQSHELSGDISAIGNGIEQKNYRSFYLSGKTLLSVGGIGDLTALGYSMDGSHNLMKSGEFTFDKWMDEYTPIGDGTTGVATAYSRVGEEKESKFTFYQVNVQGMNISKKVTAKTAALSPTTDIPYITGLRVSDSKVYLSYYLVDSANVSSTKLTDTCYVAVYTYPDFVLEQVIKDARTGPAGHFYAHQGLFVLENGDLYTMSGGAIRNGFSQSTKPSGFLRIKKGTKSFDPDYFFDISELSGGYRISHAQYLGNNLLLAEIHTEKTQTAQWMDESLKTAIIDIEKKTLTYVDGIPVHNGVGAGQYIAFKDTDGLVYTVLPKTNTEKAAIYKVNLSTHTAQKVVTVTGQDVFGIFKM